MVLYVDDDPDICEVVQTTLHLIGGLDVYTAGSGEAAIDLALELLPDVILMDVMMPDLDGPTTFKRMRDSPLIAHIPVIFMTAKVMPEEVTQLLGSGAIGVIGKPFDPLGLCAELLVLWKSAAAAGAAPPIARARIGRSQTPTPVDALSDSFLQRARLDVERLLELIERARQGELAAFAEVERVGHSLHGAGAMFGFPKVSESGEAIERLAERLPASATGPGEPRELQPLLDCIAQLSQDLDAATDALPADVGMFQL